VVNGCGISIIELILSLRLRAIEATQSTDKKSQATAREIEIRHNVPTNNRSHPRARRMVRR